MESSSSSKKEWRTKYSLKDQDSEFQTAMSPKSLLSLTVFFFSQEETRDWKEKENSTTQRKKQSDAWHREKKSRQAWHGWLARLLCLPSALVLEKQGRIRPKQKKPRRKQEAGMLPPATATDTDPCLSLLCCFFYSPASPHIIICSHITAAAAAAIVVVPAAPPPGPPPVHHH
jgi:hypothetical protein